jgi:hypothetical protein
MLRSLSEQIPATRIDATQAPISPTRVTDTVHRYFKESGPGHEAHVSSIGHMLIGEFGQSIADDWLGYKTLSQLLKRLCNLELRTEGTRTYARASRQMGDENDK